MVQTTQSVVYATRIPNTSTFDMLEKKFDTRQKRYMSGCAFKNVTPRALDPWSANSSSKIAFCIGIQ